VAAQVSPPGGRCSACYRYPIEVIGHAVWLYHRFALSLRDVEELMVARGVMLTYETIRSWLPSSGRTTPTSCVGGDPVPATNGTSMRFS
jgi:transposase-like protein